MQNIKNRTKITNPRILELIKECVDNTKTMDFKLPRKIRFLQCEATRRAGLATYKDSTIVLSTFIYKETDEAIKSVIYHEIGHLIAGPLAHHGPVWQRVVNKMSQITGIKITRLYSDSDMPIHAEERKKAYKYIFRCKSCGCTCNYLRETVFTKTYDEKTLTGKPRWTCARCGGTFEKIKG